MSVFTLYQRHNYKEVQLLCKLKIFINIQCSLLINKYVNYFRTLKDYKILGFPVKIDDKKYARNAFYFNLCFVCDSEARTVHYEPVVKKMSDFLVLIYLNQFIGIII